MNNDESSEHPLLKKQKEKDLLGQLNRCSVINNLIRNFEHPSNPKNENTRQTLETLKIQREKIIQNLKNHNPNHIKNKNPEIYFDPSSQETIEAELSASQNGTPATSPLDNATQEKLVAQESKAGICAIYNLPRNAINKEIEDAREKALSDAIPKN